jgi:hypothetical protein
VTGYLLAALLAAAAPAAAQPPDLGQQDQWGDAEKADFLKYLKSGAPAPAAGQLKDTGDGGEELLETPVRKARYATVSFTGETLFTMPGGGGSHAESTNLGPKLLLGGHLFSWVRWYGGLQYNRLEQKKLDGTQAELSHWQAPVGLEMALIPLGTPHTRYVLMRVGMSLHEFSGSAPDSDFATPLSGLQASWNGGLGYEWQIPQTSWRWNALVEGYRSMNGRFAGAGLTTGLAYTF